MKRLVYITIVFLIFSCSNEFEKEMQICSCMDKFELNYSDKGLEVVKNCLEKINVSLDINDATNSELINRMSEKGENICPEQSRKFWYFLKVLDEKNTSNTNQNVR